MRPDFDQPWFLAIATIATWLLVCFPFALMARRMARTDALNPVEAFILGQACGPVGLWLVKRANDRAILRAQRGALLRTQAEQVALARSQKVGPATDSLLTADEVPGSRAFKPPLKHKPRTTGPAVMDSWKPPDSE